MEARELRIAAEKLKKGLLAKATDGEYLDKDYRSDLAILMKDQRIAKMIPAVILANRSTADFRRAMQAESSSYVGRRQYISEQMAPVFEYIQTLEDGSDSFTHSIEKAELGERLGRGGFGSVYKYHHKLLDVDFALKLFEPVFVSNEDAVEGEKRFFREAKMLFSLNHDNIVRVYDIGRFEGLPYIRMELVNGDTIQGFVEKNGTVSFKRSKKPITSLLSGLKYAHKLGIVHRDLKPTNFMVTADGKFKIIDFGISAYLEIDGHTKLTKTGEALTGGAYTDPQLSENPKLRDVRSDIYSVGAIWYYLLVGHAPMGGDLRRNLLASGNATELEAGIILKCLSSRLEDRYSNCDELLNLLAPTLMTPKAPQPAVLKNNITEITRQAIFDYLTDRNAEEINAYVYQQSLAFQQPDRVFYYYGRRTEIQFLEKLYDLDITVAAGEYTLREEIFQHTVRNNDYEYGWVFSDEHFNLAKGDDETLLKFLAQMFHPIIRSEKSDWTEVLAEINKLLKEDGYEIYESEKISGRSVYSYRYCL